MFAISARPLNVGWAALIQTFLPLCLVFLTLQGHVNAGDTDTDDEMFGVGFDLTPGYGTVAVSFANGSNIPLGRVEGGRLWQDLMAHVSVDPQSSSQVSADSAVSVLADMLRSLARAGEDRLGQPIRAASVSMPGRTSVARYTTPVDRLVREAFAAADLEYVQIVAGSSFGEPLLYPENSVLAGHGIGLCSAYTSPRDCLFDGDKPRLPVETYYFVGYYANELEVATTSPVVSAYSVSPYPFVDYRLGADMRRRNPDQAFYWEEVRRHLSLPFVTVPHRKPSKVILYGDHSGDPRLRQAVMEVLKAFLTDREMPEWIDDGRNATFVSAMGAAEFAKRKPYWGVERLTADQLKAIEPKLDL